MVRRRRLHLRQAAGRGRRTGADGAQRDLDVPCGRRRRDPGRRRPAAGGVALSVEGRALPVLPRLHGSAGAAGPRCAGRALAGAPEGPPHGRGAQHHGGDRLPAGPRLERQRLRSRDLAGRAPPRLRPPDRRRHDLVPRPHLRPARRALDPRPRDGERARRDGPHHRRQRRGDQDDAHPARLQLERRRVQHRDHAGRQDPRMLDVASGEVTTVPFLDHACNVRFPNSPAPTSA